MEDEQNQPKINSEVIKHSIEEVEDDQIDKDGISSLPDWLLVEIISCLPETKEAIRTSTLSKRWQHLWRQLPNLSFWFCACMFCSGLDWDFCSFVDKTLNQCSRQLNLNKFKLMYHTLAFLDYSKINDWIRYATNRNVQELELSLRNDFVFDQSFFMNSCFTYLYLGHCNIYPTGAISWTKLTSLAIYNMTIDDNLIQNILCGSPLLETLSLESCNGVSWLDVTSKSVKNLILSQGFFPHHICQINAPHILSLTIKGTIYLWELVFLNLSSLVKVDLEYQQSFCHVRTPKHELVDEEMLKWFLSSFSHVKELKLNYCCTKIFTRLKAKGFLCPSSIKYQLEGMVNFCLNNN